MGIWKKILYVNRGRLTYYCVINALQSSVRNETLVENKFLPIFCPYGTFKKTQETETHPFEIAALPRQAFINFLKQGYHATNQNRFQSRLRRNRGKTKRGEI